MLQDFGTSKDLLAKTPEAQTIKEKTDKWDYIIAKKFLHSKGSSQQSEHN